MSIDKIKEWAMKYLRSPQTPQNDLIPESDDSEMSIEISDDWRLSLFLKTAKLEKISEFFEGMSEEDRQKYLPTVKSWFRESNRNVDRAGVCGLLATGTFDDIKKLRLRNTTWTTPQCFTKVLRSRKLPWTTDFVRWLFGQITEFSDADAWHWYRDLYRDGLCERLLDLPVIQQFFQVHEHLDIVRERNHKSTPLDEYLLADPELLEVEIWKIFELPVTSEITFATKQSTSRSRFFHAFRKLSDDGRISRDRLLTSCLNALLEGFSEKRESWYLLLFEHLQPRPEELSERKDTLLAVLDNRNTITASKMLGYLKTLDQNNSIDPLVLLKHLRPLLLDRSKGRVKTLVGFVTQLVRKNKSNRELLDEAARFSLEALSHDDAEIQSSAMQLLLKSGDPESKIISAQLNKIRPDLVPSVLALLPKSPQREVPPIASCPEMKPKHPVSPLDSQYEIAAISDSVELIDAANEFAHHTSDAEQLERILDGIARLGLGRPDHFKKMVSPLKKIADEWLRREAFLRGNMGNCFIALVLAWIDDTPKAGESIRQLIGNVMKESVIHDTKTIIPFFRRRIAAQIRRLQKNISNPLLDTPTHRGGFIDPIIFVERLTKPGTNLFLYGDAEKQLALLRLAKENRTEALERLNKSHLTGDRSEYLEAVRYVFGVEDIVVGRDASLWETAAFACDPRRNHEKILTVHKGLGCFEILDQAYLFGISDSSTRGPIDVLSRFFPIGDAKRDMMDFPTVLLHTNPYDTLGGGIMGAHWQRTVSPGRLEPYFYVGLDTLIRWDGMEDMLVPFLEPMLESHAKLSELGAVFVLTALAGQPILRQLATDILISAIDTDRLERKAFGIALRALFNREFITQSFKPNLKDKGVDIHSRTVLISRWSKELSIIARYSPRHGEIMRTGLEMMLNGKPYHNVGPLLELLYELNIAANERIHLVEARSYLESFSGNGKAAKLAKKLLEL